MQRRIEFAEGMVANGFPTHQIVWRLTEKFKVTPRQAEKYLERARAQMREHDKQGPEEKRQQYEAMLLTVYREAIITKDLKAATMAVKELRALNGFGGLSDMFARVLHQLGAGGEDDEPITVPLDPKALEGLYKMRDRLLRRAGTGDMQALEQVTVLTQRLVRKGIPLEAAAESGEPRGLLILPEEEMDSHISGQLDESDDTSK